MISELAAKLLTGLTGPVDPVDGCVRRFRRREGEKPWGLLEPRLGMPQMGFSHEVSSALRFDWFFFKGKKHQVMSYEASLGWWT